MWGGWIIKHNTVIVLTCDCRTDSPASVDPRNIGRSTHDLIDIALSEDLITVTLGDIAPRIS